MCHTALLQCLLWWVCNEAKQAASCSMATITNSRKCKSKWKTRYGISVTTTQELWSCPFPLYPRENQVNNIFFQLFSVICQKKKYIHVCQNQACSQVWIWGGAFWEKVDLLTYFLGEYGLFRVLFGRKWTLLPAFGSNWTFYTVTGGAKPV